MCIAFEQSTINWMSITFSLFFFLLPHILTVVYDVSPDLVFNEQNQKIMKINRTVITETCLLLKYFYTKLHVI